MSAPTIEQLRTALKARHADELRAFESLVPFLEGSLRANGKAPGKKTGTNKPPSRAGTGKIRNAVLPAFSRDFLSIEQVAKETGFKSAQVRGVVTAPVLKDRFAKKEVGGVMHYKFEGVS